MAERLWEQWPRLRAGIAVAFGSPVAAIIAEEIETEIGIGIGAETGTEIGTVIGEAESSSSRDREFIYLHECTTIREPIRTAAAEATAVIAAEALTTSRRAIVTVSIEGKRMPATAGHSIQTTRAITETVMPRTAMGSVEGTKPVIDNTAAAIVDGKPAQPYSVKDLSKQGRTTDPVCFLHVSPSQFPIILRTHYEFGGIPVISHSLTLTLRDG